MTIFNEYDMKSINSFNQAPIIMIFFLKKWTGNLLETYTLDNEKKSLFWSLRSTKIMVHFLVVHIWSMINKF